MDHSIVQQLRDPVFKGCTRPATLLGVPLVPLVVISGSCLVFAMWLLLIDFWFSFAVMIFLVLAILLMRQVTTRDDQRLRQWQLRLWLRVANRNRRFWGATSYAANRYKKR